MLACHAAESDAGRGVPAHFNVFRVVSGMVVELLQKTLIIVLALVGELP